MPVKAEDLKHGRTYFALFFASDRRDQPVVETFVFIGSDAGEFTFQLARSYYQHGDWNQMTMDERDEYVDPPIVNFDPPSLSHIYDAAGLAAELSRA